MAKSLRRPADVPEWLSKQGRELWYAVGASRASVGRRVLIEAALRHLDVAQRAMEAVSKDGFVLKSRRSKMAHIHPLLPLVASEQAKFERLWIKLSLHFNFVIDSRIDSRTDDEANA